MDQGPRGAPPGRHEGAGLLLKCVKGSLDPPGSKGYHESMTTAQLDPATMTPAAIDGRLSEILTRGHRALSLALSYRTYAAKADGLGRLGSAGDYTSTAERYETEALELRAEAEPFEAEFVRRGGWNRYFLVTNGNGHVHRGMTCSTCFPTTEYAWLVDLADCDEAAMVAEWGEQACTVCFPDAPTRKGYGDGTSSYAKRTKADREARSAERAAAAAAKAAKAITAPDGSPLRVGGWVIKTKIAARNELSGRVKDYCLYGPGHPSDFAGQIRALAEALEAAGVETAPVIERAKKQARRDGFTFEWQG